VLAWRATPRPQLDGRAVLAAVLAVAGWALFAALAPTLLGIDHRGLQSIVGAGDHTALCLSCYSGATYPLKALAPIAAIAGLVAIATAWLSRAARRRNGEPGPRLCGGRLSGAGLGGG